MRAKVIGHGFASPETTSGIESTDQRFKRDHFKKDIYSDITTWKSKACVVNDDHYDGDSSQSIHIRSVFRGRIQAAG